MEAKKGSVDSFWGNLEEERKKMEWMFNPMEMRY